MLSRKLVLLAGVASVVMVLSQAVEAFMYTPNLLPNPDAEAAAGASDFNTIAPPDGWMVTEGNFTVVQYAAGGTLDLNIADSGAIGGGANYFAGGPNNTDSAAAVFVDVSAYASVIDSELALAELSADLGGFDTQNDNMAIEVWFYTDLSATDALGGMILPGPIAAERGNVSKLQRVTAPVEVVPIGTRWVIVEMSAHRTNGIYNDGYVDNLVFRLGLIPEPASLGFVGLGALALVAGRRGNR